MKFPVLPCYLSLLANIYSSTSYSQTPSTCVPPSMSVTKFHTRLFRNQNTKNILKCRGNVLCPTVSRRMTRFFKKSESVTMNTVALTEENVNSFHRAMSSVIVTAQCFGLLPVIGITGPNAASIR
jgi:hypothetical protein